MLYNTARYVQFYFYICQRDIRVEGGADWRIVRLGGSQDTICWHALHICVIIVFVC